LTNFPAENGIFRFEKIFKKAVAKFYKICYIFSV